MIRTLNIISKTFITGMTINRGFKHLVYNMYICISILTVYSYICHVGSKGTGAKGGGE